MLHEGNYREACRERALAAKTAGHGEVYPQADMLVAYGWATFTRDGVEVCSCSERRADAHFDVQPA